MSDGKAKGIVGAILTVSLLSVKMCDHEGCKIVRNIHEITPVETAGKSEIKSATETAEKDTKNAISDNASTSVSEPSSHDNEMPSNQEERSIDDGSAEIHTKLPDESKSEGKIMEQKIDFNAKGLFKDNVFIADKDLSDEEVKALSNQGIQFICNKKIYEEQSKITDFEVLFVYSNDLDELKDLYGVMEAQAKEIINTTEGIRNNFNVKTVANKGELERALQRNKTMDKTSVLVCHNKGSQLFGTPISDYQLSNLLTCNSFSIQGETFFKSTGFIELPFVIESLKFSLAWRNNPDQNLYEFYRDFSTKYSSMVKNRTNTRVAVVLTASGATLSGIGAIVYFNTNKS